MTTIEEYRKADGLNFSKAKLLLQSPAHFKAAVQVEETPSMAAGTLLHAYALQGIKLPYIVRPELAPDGSPWHGSKKVCKEWMAQQPAGVPVFTQSEVADQAGMVAALEASQEFQTISRLCPRRERPAFATYRGVPLKALFDMEGVDAGGAPMICDLKSCSDGSPDGFARSAVKYRYALQCVYYSTVLALEQGLESRPGFLWVTVESSAPYPVTVYSVSNDAWDTGQRQMDTIIDRYLWCMEHDQWPAAFAWDRDADGKLTPRSGIQELPWPAWASRETDAA